MAVGIPIKNHFIILRGHFQWKSEGGRMKKERLLEIPEDYMKEESKDQGSYLLVLILKRDLKINVGRFGKVSFRKGFYIYIGSAMANLSKRMERHRRIRKRHHWHIDELRAVAEFHSLLAIRSSERLECEIAKTLSGIAEWSIAGFGSSDCSCETHLFGMSKDPLHTGNFHKLVQYFRMERLSLSCPVIL
jgi:sugar fermentation stimulation protein A